MVDEKRGLAIVFNGEIYNFHELKSELERLGYSFFSRSDTEVILASYRHWGAECLARFNGTFAFAIFDAEQHTVFLARDRAGEKPLFYYLSADGLRFASELKALLTDPLLPRKIDRASLDCYLTMGYVPGGRAILNGFNKLPPAHAMKFDLATGQSKLWRYWRIPSLSPEAVAGKIDNEGLLADLESLLKSAVRYQLAADVDVGVLLSGGVDSSLITALAARSARKVKTFTVCFPGHSMHDETEHARLIARAFDTQHTEIVAEPNAADLLPRLAVQFDEPIADSSMIPTFILAQAVRNHCMVALGGDGGDELFGGYDRYSRFLALQRYAGAIPHRVRRIPAALAGRLLPLGFRGRNWIMASGADFSSNLPPMVSLFDTAFRHHLLDGGKEAIAELILGEFLPYEDDMLQQATRMDFASYLPEDILVKVDRASMLNSLEVRSPLLDYRVIEFAFSRIPSRLKATAWEKKILLKRLAVRLLPLSFDHRRKQGFSIPLAAWLKGGPFKDLFRDVLLDKECLFNRQTVNSLLKGQEHGLNNAERLFSLVVFELWRRHYHVDL